MSLIRQTSFDIIHRLRSADSHADIYAELKRTGAVFGYDVFLLGGLPHSTHQNLLDCIMVSGWPMAWAERYQTKRYLHRDPVIRHIRATTEPFLWEEAVEQGSPDGALVMDEARAFGLLEGFCVPFHDLDGNEAGVSFGGEQIRLSEDERAGLHLVAIYAMSQAKALARQQVGTSLEPETAALTAREIECLRWAADGKTAWETSVILQISARTVEHHLANAARRLNAVGRVHSVAEALRRRLID